MFPPMSLGEAAIEGAKLLYPLRYGEVSLPSDVEASGLDAAERMKQLRHDHTKYNRMGYACMVHSILPSRGPDACIYSGRCSVASDPLRRHDLCSPGRPCPVEAEYYRAYVEAGRKQFARALQWLDDVEWYQSISDLAILDLRKVRVSARIRDEGFLRTVRRRRPDGLSEEVQVPTLACRYDTAVDREFNRIFMKLMVDPRSDEEISSQATTDIEHLQQTKDKFARLEAEEDPLD